MWDYLSPYVDPIREYKPYALAGDTRTSESAVVNVQILDATGALKSLVVTVSGSISASIGNITSSVVNTVSTLTTASIIGTVYNTASIINILTSSLYDLSRADSTRTTASMVLPVQIIGGLGNVWSVTAANTARNTASLVSSTQIIDASGSVFNLSPANATRTTASNVLMVQNINSYGMPGLASEAVIYAASASKVTQVGGVVMTSSVPSISNDNTAVPLWMDQFGRQIRYGDDLSTGATMVEDISPASLQNTNVTLLSAVTATGSSPSLDISLYSKHTVHWVSTGSATGTIMATCSVDVSLDNTNWLVKNTNLISTATITEYILVDTAYNYLRANVSAYSGSGTYTATYFGKP